MEKVPPSTRMKKEVERVLSGGTVEGAPVEAPMQGFVRSLARYILQVSIEEEATTFLGRGHYRRGQRARPGWRNGYEAKRLQTEAGLLELAVPQLRATPEPFRPALLERLGSRTADLEGLVRGMYVRGLSTRDVSDLYGEAFGVTTPHGKAAMRKKACSRPMPYWRMGNRFCCTSTWGRGSLMTPGSVFCKT